MKLLVIAQGYPSPKDIYASAFIHTRHLYYREQNVHVEVVSFTCRQPYEFEGIKVYPEGLFKQLVQRNNYDAIICHAPNLRNHLRLVLPIIDKLPKIFFIFHGHEVLNNSRYYPEPYGFQKGNLYFLNKAFHKLYDRTKCFFLRKVIKKYGGKKIFLIFVSQYLQKLFEENIGIPSQDTKSFSEVINNPIHPSFINSSYDWRSEKKYDFITIRPFDKPVYAMDLVLKIAQQNPEKSFHIFGKGHFFHYHDVPKNVKVTEGFIAAHEIPNLLNQYKAALMPSFHDSQGVMACEMAAFGIPLIVSDIPAAKEMLANIPNVFFIKNNEQDFNLGRMVLNISTRPQTNLKSKLSLSSTASKELEFINKML